MLKPIMVECTICTKEVERLDKINGEQMCQECYEHPDNQVFED